MKFPPQPEGPTQPTYADYHEGLVIAHERRQIIHADKRLYPYGPYDEFSHLPDKPWLAAIGNNPPAPGKLRQSNTRALNPFAAMILELIAESRSKSRSGVSILEVGHGSGVTAFGMRQLMQSLGVPCTITTVAHTPVDPYTGLCTPSPQLLETIYKRRGEVADIPDVDLLLEGLTDPTQKTDAIGLDSALTLAEILHLDFAQRLSEPYIDKQYIGHFPTDVTVPANQRFDFVYDNRASFTYTDHFAGPYNALTARMREDAVLFIGTGVKAFCDDSHRSQLSSVPGFWRLSQHTDKGDKDFGLISKTVSALHVKIISALKSKGVNLLDLNAKGAPQKSRVQPFTF